MTKLIVAFLNFVKTPKKDLFYLTPMEQLDTTVLHFNVSFTWTNKTTRLLYKTMSQNTTIHSDKESYLLFFLVPSIPLC